MSGVGGGLGVFLGGLLTQELGAGFSSSTVPALHGHASFYPQFSDTSRNMMINSATDLPLG
jgi:hypothetical protein